jgi:hypothetical protein
MAIFDIIWPVLALLALLALIPPGIKVYRIVWAILRVWEHTIATWANRHRD